ncbi:hypothetical protein [Streptomyces griseocarneus]|uniref:hypothetical protein n=1 Tax=Streptomyces griseocarneus TaxID=51201 RepID=UPI00167D81EF|nr:hypothetical protein [Streptomyces griseocarneus]MBZ6476751.1 hypothetical protein [Streptomyces griseocarneus]
MTAPTAAVDLTPEQITVPLDTWDRPVVVLPDDVAARMAASSRTDVKNYGYCHFESRRFSPDSYETRAIQTIFESVLAAHPDEQGLGQYERYGTGYFYGYIVGTSGWDASARTWRDYENTQHLHVDGIHLRHDGRSHFGS